MKNLLILSLIFGAGLITFLPAQSKTLDSLYAVLKTRSEDTSKVNTLYAIAFELRGSNPDSSIYFANNSLELSKKLNYKFGEANAYLCIAFASSEKGETKLAVEKVNHSIKIYDELLKNTGSKDIVANNRVQLHKAKGLSALAAMNFGIGKYEEALACNYASLKIRAVINDRKGVAMCYSKIGNIFNNKGDYPEAIRNYSIALKNYELNNDLEGIASVNISLGRAYTDLGQYPEALKHDLAALQINETLKDHDAIGASYNDIGIVYYYNKNYSEALNYWNKALEIRRSQKDTIGMAGTSMNMGNVYSDQANSEAALEKYFRYLRLMQLAGNNNKCSIVLGNIGNKYKTAKNYKKAIEIYSQALALSEEIGDKGGIVSAYQGLGRAYTDDKQFTIARRYLEKSKSLSREIGYQTAIRKSYFMLAYLDSSTGHFSGAFENYKTYINHRDSIFNKENDQKILQAQIQYEFDKKETLANAEQEKRDFILAEEIQKQKLLRSSFLTGFFVVVIFAITFFTQRNKIKKGKKLSDDLLLNILPSEVAEELKLNGNSVAKQFDDVTVLFTDCKDFSLISEKMSPRELAEEIDTCYKAFDRIMEKNGIEKIRTIGDSYMVAGGLPVENKANAINVVDSAIEILQFTNQRLEEKRVNGKYGFEIRLGVNTGQVVAGIVGVKKFVYDIWGDTVNIASRMESSGETGKVNISGAIYALVKQKYNCLYRGKIDAKNRGLIDMYFVGALIKN